jgi:TPR repeat protein
MFRGSGAIFLAWSMWFTAMAQDAAAVEALLQQGVKHEYGVGLSGVDLPGAIRLYQQGVQQGYGPSMVRLAYMKHWGKGMPVDLPGAFALYSEAARRGSREGQYMQALCQATGVGTAKDPATARRLMLTPAEAGHQDAQYALAVMIALGEGGPKGGASARRWFDRAAAGPNRELAAKAASQRDKIDQNLFAKDTSGRDLLIGLAVFLVVAGALAGGSGGSGYDSPYSSGPGFGGGPSSSYTGSPYHTASPMNGNIYKTLHGEAMLGLSSPNRNVLFSAK